MKKGTYEDQIRIEELEVYAHHGVYPEENEKGQHFYVNATLYTNTRPAGLADDLNLSTNYGEVCQFITEFMQQHTFQLIETVAERTAYEVLQYFPLVQGLDLEIRKPEAPIPLPFGSVSVAIHREWHEAYIAVGSNMGDSREHIAQALGQLQKNKDIRVEKVSELLETLPYGVVEQDNFVNGMFGIRTLLAPEELLQELHRIEQMEGRERKLHWGPRTLDLDILFYDKELIEIASREKGVPFDEFAKADEKKASQWRYSVEYDIQIDREYHFTPINDVLFDAQKEIILNLADKEDCVIVGRCANYILKDKALSLFIYAPFEDRLKTVMERTGREEKSARKMIKKIDKDRRAYYEYFTDEYWMDLLHYDLCINSSRFTTQQIISMAKEGLSDR